MIPHRSDTITAAPYCQNGSATKKTQDFLILRSLKKYDSISYSKVLAENLDVMDSSAISLARDNKIPIIIFSIKETNSFFSAIKGKLDTSIIKD